MRCSFSTPSLRGALATEQARAVPPRATLCGWRVYRQMPPQPSVAQSEMYVTVHLPGRHLRPEFGKDMLMKFSSSFVVPSAVAVLSTALLCAPAASQIPTGSAATIPPVTVDAPKQVAKPHVSERGANTTAPRRTASTARTSTASTPSYAPGSVMGRIASLEKVASSCNGGCASSFPSGKDPWVGCSESGGGTNYGPFSPTCRDTITHTSYEGCVETKVFLGENRNKAHWFCSSLQAGNRFKVAELKRSARR
ncbi:hypothetical protein ABIF86_004049 [Bradyrhizobium japonicum]